MRRRDRKPSLQVGAIPAEWKNCHWWKLEIPANLGRRTLAAPTVGTRSWAMWLPQYGGDYPRLVPRSRPTNRRRCRLFKLQPTRATMGQNQHDAIPLKRGRPLGRAEKDVGDCGGEDRCPCLEGGLSTQKWIDGLEFSWGMPALSADSTLTRRISPAGERLPSPSD